jgi:GLPGLI family protein
MMRTIKIKRLLCSFLLIIAGYGSFAQETIAYNVMYEFRYVRDLANKSNPYVQNMILTIGQHTSRYISERDYKEYNKYMAKKKLQAQRPAQAMPATAAPAASAKPVYGGYPLKVVRSGAAILEEIMKDQARHTMETIGLMNIKANVVETPLPAFNWVLKPEKKTIDKYTCQKAVGNYAGRVYEVWFTTELPYHDGPWKLSGLPGLILEGHDANNEIAFSFKGITPNNDGEAKVVSFYKEFPVVKTNLKSYHRVMQAYAEDPEAVITAAFPDPRIMVTCIDGSGTKQAIKVKKYNPIEKD